METGKVRLVPRGGIEDETLYRHLTGTYMLSCSRDDFCFCISLDCMDVFFIAMALNVLRRFDNYLLAVGFRRC
jgi:hypothetical protein